MHLRILALLFVITTKLTAQQSYFLNGNAIALGGDCYQLTDIWNNQNGTVWYADQIDLNQNFDITFLMNLGSNDANGADGVCFVLQNLGTSAIGISGGGMGYQSFTTSLGIEFDTWQNGKSTDPTYDHIAIQKNGSVNHLAAENLAGPVQMDAFSTNTEDGTNHVVRINWDASTHVIQVYFDCVFRLQATVDIVAEIFSGQPLVYWGFTAATGGATNIQKVCLTPNILASANQLQACPGTTIQLSAGASLNGVYDWSPGTGLSDSTIVNPIASPTQTTTYTVTFTNLCGLQQTSDITITVDDLQITIPETTTLSCSDTLATIPVSSNFIDLHYQWSTSDGQIIGVDTLSSLNTSTAGTYIINADYQNQCFDADTIVVNADYSDFTLSMAYDSVLTCIDDQLILFSSTGIPGTQFSWTTNTGSFVGGSNTSTATIDAPGAYTVNAYYNSNCQDAFTLNVSSNQIFPIVQLSGDTVINCADPIANITTSSTATANGYNWTTNNGGVITSPTNGANIEASTSGVYIVNVTDLTNGCVTSEAVSLTTDTIHPIITLSESDTLSCKHPVVTLDNYALQSVSNPQFSWSTIDGNFQGLTSLANPIVTTEGTYTLTVTNQNNGCSSLADFTVPINENIHFDVQDIELPNIITFNGDSANYIWRPFLKSNAEEDIMPYLSEYRLQVFNRWGNRVFESTVSTPYWKPNDLSEGTYYYILEFLTYCGEGASTKTDGSITILR
jgi:Bacterial lectin/CHU_C Type IX secretion signal domain